MNLLSTIGAVVMVLSGLYNIYCVAGKERRNSFHVLATILVMIISFISISLGVGLLLRMWF